jgi:hypothetical protein
MADARPEMPPGIEDRDADLWEPLLAIADAVGGDWPERARRAAVALVGAAREIEPSLGIRLLTDLKIIFDERGAAAIPTTTILESLIALPESPWGDLKGKPINDRTLARRLRQYSIASKQIRFSDAVTLKGYARDDLHDAWLRYLPPPPSAAEAKQAKQAEQGPEIAGVAGKNVSDGAEDERNIPDGERNNGRDVSDSERNKPPERNGNSPIKSSTVSDVSLVSDVGGGIGEKPPSSAPSAMPAASRWSGSMGSIPRSGCTPSAGASGSRTTPRLTVSRGSCDALRSAHRAT